jgi:hypothetical protein
VEVDLVAVAMKVKKDRVDKVVGIVEIGVV